MPVTRVRVPESTNIDWCYNLILTAHDADALRKNNYWWENLPYKGGLVKYTEDGQYSIDVGREGRVERYYSQTCLSQYGHHSDCAELQELFTKATQGAQEYNSFKCTEDALKGGCNCSFNIGEANSVSGAYSVSGATITHFSATPLRHFSKASMCVRGDRMQLSGQDNSFLWDRASLRTIELVRVNCNDGKQGPGEEGVDCGLRCPTACPE